MTADPKDLSMDVVVIGAGMSGLCAALAAAAQGASVTVLAKMPRAGGNARVSAGFFLGATNFDALHAYVPDGDPALQSAFCEDYAPAVAWLEAQGLPVDPLVDFGDFRVIRPMGLGQPGARHPFTDRMIELATARGVTLRRDARVTAIAREGGVAREGTLFRIDIEGGAPLAARSVIIATGGFAGSPALLAHYMGPAASALRPRTLPGASGDGLQLAQSLGAATAGDMQAFYGHTMADCHLEPHQWQPMTPYFARLGILVNRDGRRFIDESVSLLEELNPQAAFRQPGGKFWLMFDHRILTGEGLDAGTSATPPDWLDKARAIGAPITEAASLNALCDLMGNEGLPGAALLAEIGRYNAAVRAGSATELDPARRQNAVALERAPFYALRCVAAITATCGGIAVDPQCRVLDGGRRPVPGLHAAGVDAGGIWGKTYGGFLSWSLVSGRRAGRQAAQHAQSST